MKLVIFLAAVALSSGAKLDRTYLPPTHAQTSGGSGNFLQTPVSGSTQDYQGFQGVANYQENVVQNNLAFAQNVDNYAKGGQSGNNYDQSFAQGGNSFEQSGSGFAQNGNGFAQTGNSFTQNDFGSDDSRPERPQASFERNAAILRFDNANDGETYAYAYETENGIIAEENGVATNGVEAQGGYSYTGDDGKVYSIRYTADQNGFQPQGDHLPTPPPIPEEILKALEQNARDEANGIFDDGTYNEAKYSDSENAQQNNNYKNEYNYNNGNGNNFNVGGDFSNQGVSANDDDAVVTNNALIRSNNEQTQAEKAGFGNRNAQASFGQNKGAPFGNQNSQAAYNNQNTQAIFRNQNNQATFGNQVAQANFGNQNAQAAFGNQNTQATFGNQYTQAAFRQNSESFNQNGVPKAYLPPTNVQRGQSRYQQNNGFRSQNGLEKSYLPPQQFGQRTGQNGGRYNQRNGLRNGSTEKAYLPPFSQGQGQNGKNQIAFGQPQNYRGQVGSQSNRGASREYLPPFNRSNDRGRRPSFDAENGYQY